VGINRRARKKRIGARILGVAFVLVLLAVMILLPGCGGGLTGGGTATQPVAQPGTLPSSYSVKVTASEGTLTRSTSAMLTVQ
jgi:hypothetical protein